jgi:hypothetical protein
MTADTPLANVDLADIDTPALLTEVHRLTARIDPARLPQWHIGENIVVTYTEAMAISLEKVEKKSAD